MASLGNSVVCRTRGVAGRLCTVGRCPRVRLSGTPGKGGSIQRLGICSYFGNSACWRLELHRNVLAHGSPVRQVSASV